MTNKDRGLAALVTFIDLCEMLQASLAKTLSELSEGERDDMRVKMAKLAAAVEQLTIASAAEFGVTDEDIADFRRRNRQ